MPEFVSEVDVYVDEFWSACSIREKEELIDIMERYKNEEYVFLSDKELDELKSKTIYKINNITVF